MNQEEMQVIAFEIILHSGTARTEVHGAFDDMRHGRYLDAETKLEKANADLVKAHHAQTKLLQDYASGVAINLEIILVHAQDHLMTTITLREVAIEMLEMNKKIDKMQ